MGAQAFFLFRDGLSSYSGVEAFRQAWQFSLIRQATGLVGLVGVAAQLRLLLSSMCPSWVKAIMKFVATIFCLRLAHLVCFQVMINLCYSRPMLHLGSPLCHSLNWLQLTIEKNYMMTMIGAMVVGPDVRSFLKGAPAQPVVNLPPIEG